MMRLSSRECRPPYGRPPIGGISKIQLLNFQIYRLKNVCQSSQETFFQPNSVFVFQSPRNCKIQSNWISPESYRYISMPSLSSGSRRPPYGHQSTKIQSLNFQFNSTENRLPKFPGKLLPAHLRFCFSVCATSWTVKYSQTEFQPDPYRHIWMMSLSSRDGRPPCGHQSTKIQLL